MCATKDGYSVDGIACLVLDHSTRQQTNRFTRKLELNYAQHVIPIVIEFNRNEQHVTNLQFSNRNVDSYAITAYCVCIHSTNYRDR